MIECLDQWFETGIVCPSKHPPEFEAAVIAQGRIGWRHFFMGKIAIEWLTAYKKLCNGRDRNKKVESWIWGR
jgi:hypothetical protein